MVSSGEIAVSLRSLQALASNARMDVLRCLTSRRMTAAEVSAKLGIRKSSAHKHLSRLARAGFVTRHDDDRVWVYYNLTNEGRHLVTTERPRLVLLLSSALILTTLSLVFIAWRIYAWRNTDGDGTWGVDEIFPRPRAGFFTVTVILAVTLVILATAAAIPIARRLASRPIPGKQ